MEKAVIFVFFTDCFYFLLFDVYIVIIFFLLFGGRGVSGWVFVMGRVSMGLVVRFVVGDGRGFVFCLGVGLGWGCS